MREGMALCHWPLMGMGDSEKLLDAAGFCHPFVTRFSCCRFAAAGRIIPYLIHQRYEHRNPTCLKPSIPTQSNKLLEKPTKEKKQ